MPGLPSMPGVKKETKFDELRSVTYPGQAHWGGSGPKRKTCRECVHWGEPKREFAYFSDGSGLKPQKCGRYFAMTGTWGAGVPHEAKACRDFLEAKDPPKAHN